MTVTTDLQLRLLLLRRLPREEAQRVEDSIVLEEGIAERLRAEEFDLLDDYARGTLSDADRADVERYVLTSADRIDSLRVSQALLTHANPARTTPIPAPMFKWRSARAVTVGAALAAGLASLVVIPYWRAPPPAAERPSLPRSAGLSSAAGAAPPAIEPAAGGDGPIVTLLADRDRGAAPPPLLLPAADAAIRLQVEVPGPARDAAYSLQVDDSAGTRQFAAASLAARTVGPYRYVEAAVPLPALGPGARTITLRVQGSDAPEYQWQVIGVLGGAAQKK